MKLELRHVGVHPNKNVKILATVGGTMTDENLTVSDEMVSYDLIQNLRDIADELEGHNQKVANQTDF